jgi:rSAM/selenodomain-associated transferase 1
VDRLIVFLKSPSHGEVKTRLASQLDHDAAAAIYRVLINKTLRALFHETEVELRFSPDDAWDDIQPWLRDTWHAHPQGNGDLGTRLERAAEVAFSGGASRVVIIGTDCPALEARDLHLAWNALATHDLVVGPSMDGGYWLIGTQVWPSGIFRDIPWSTSDVLATTLQRAAEHRFRVHQLRPLLDIDTLQDWRRWLRAGDKS